MKKDCRVYPEIMALVHAYDVNYPDESLTHTPDDNTKIVLEYLRCRNLGGEAVAKEFDNTQLGQVHLEAVSPDTYSDELHKLKQMSKSGRKKFMERVWTNQGMFKDDWGTWRVEGISRGRFCHPFGIHPDTMISITFGGFGGHNIQAVKRMMKQRLKAIDLMRDGEPTYSAVVDDKLEIEVVAGFVTEHVRPFDVPILELFVEETTEKIARKIGQNIISKKQMIPIDSQGSVVDHNYISRPVSKPFLVQ